MAAVETIDEKFKQEEQAKKGIEAEKVSLNEKLTASVQESKERSAELLAKESELSKLAESITALTEQNKKLKGSTEELETQVAEFVDENFSLENTVKDL